MSFKISLLFQDGTGSAAGGPQPFSHLGGWSETCYYVGSDIDYVRALLFTNGPWGIELAGARANLLPSSASIIGARIGTWNPKIGRSQTLKIARPGQSGFVTDVPQMALQCTVPGLGVTNIRRFALRGIPDGLVAWGELVPGVSTGPAMLTYFASLANFYFAGQDFLQPVFAIIGIDANGVMTTTAATNFQVGDKVKITGGTQTGTGLFVNLVATVTAVAGGGTQITLQDWLDGACTGGTVRKYLIILHGMSAAGASVDRVVVRKVGRPFEQYRGRRSKGR
jgi:hypothetical protein